MLCWIVLAAAGCTLPPDVLNAPDPGPAPAYARDASRNGGQPIPSAILDRALRQPQAHELVLLEDGDDALLARIHLIRAARQTIDIQTFTWVYDRSGSWVFRELLEAARRGVRVRVLVDQVVPPGVSSAEFAAIVTAHHNIEVRLFRPLTTDAINTAWTYTSNTFTRYATLNRRMHNKVMLVDHAVAVTGGRNYLDSYYDRDAELNFLDRDVLFAGPAVAEAAASFEEFWNSRKSVEASRMHDLREELEGGRPRLPDSLSGPVDPVFAELDRLAGAADLAQARPALRSWRVQHIRYLSDSPAKLNPFGIGSDRDAFEPLMDAMREAQSEILMQTPYAVIGSTTNKLMRKIRKGQPDIRIRLVTNSVSASDNIYAAGIALKQRRLQIEQLGFELFATKPVPGGIRSLVSRYDELMEEVSAGRDTARQGASGLPQLDIEGPRFCMHSKSMVIERKLSYIGSHNFDPRSFNLNTECGVLVDDQSFAAHLGGLIERMSDPGNSWVVAPRRYPPVMAELNSLLSLISSSLPLFDIWPLEHVSCYELREGRQPVPAGHPDFHEHYRDVGPLPGLDIGLRSVQAQLVRGFAGIATPLM